MENDTGEPRSMNDQCIAFSDPPGCWIVPGWYAGSPHRLRDRRTTIQERSPERPCVETDHQLWRKRSGSVLQLLIPWAPLQDQATTGRQCRIRNGGCPQGASGKQRDHKDKADPKH